VFLVREAIRTAGLDPDLRVVSDGEQAIRFLDDLDANKDAECPALLIIDINLPRRNGGEVIGQMRKSRRCAKTLVIVVTSSDSARDRDDMAKLGVDAYFRKPSDYEGFLRLGDLVKSLLEPMVFT
jgi:DNA-binding response OmpR family regulator